MTVNRNGVDQGAVSKRTVTAKGNLIVGTANSVVSNLAVGNDGEQIVADSSTSTGLRYNGNYAAGKNKIINGDFGVWQRGTSFSITGQAYLVDRWLWTGGGSGATRTLTQQTFTPGTAPVAGYEGTYFARYTQSVAGTGSTYNQFQTRLEDVRLFAGQTATISFWAKADATRSLDLYIGQNFGSGGSGAVETAFTGSPVSLTTSWARYTATVTVPSVSGKTIGTGSYLYFYFGMPNNVVQTIDYWGVQLEQGSVASAFNTATGTVQGELAACQRYYWRSTASAAYPYALLGNSSGIGTGANTVSMNLFHPVTMRTNPTAVEYGGTFYVLDGTGGGTGVTLAINVANTFSTNVTATKTGAFTQYRPYFLQAWGDAAAYVGLTAEL
jgi:hypothetical protein